MTPGYAKPRSELPWLPYPESDKVFVINAHNFGGGAFSPAVNGKMPVAAWIPSLDDTGNGTTTLTDLVGSNNGTLTNMDASTDWVADTGAGGVRSLDFDAVNDYVSIPIFSIAAPMALSAWMKVETPKSQHAIFCSDFDAPLTRPRVFFDIQQVSGTTYRMRGYIGTTYDNAATTFTIDSNWHHYMWFCDASNNWSFYRDGALHHSVTRPIAGNIGTFGSIGQATNITSFSTGAKLDDARLFLGATLDATDAADLYAAGRGGDAS